MTTVAPLARIPVGVVVERRKATTPWADFIWRPVAVLPGLPDATPWTPLAQYGDAVAYYAGPAEIALYRTEADNYRRNLASGAPAVWVALQATGGNPPFEIAIVTADPAEGEAFTDAGSYLVEAVPMPSEVVEAIVQFIAEHHVERPFVKRRRAPAEPTLARREDEKGRR